MQMFFKIEAEIERAQEIILEVSKTEVPAIFLIFLASSATPMNTIISSKKIFFASDATCLINSFD